MVMPGFAEAERAQAARLFWQAFAAKLGKVMGPEDKALRFFEAALDPRFALVARDDDGRLLGLVGFKTEEGGLTDAGLRDLAQVYGWFGSLWRAVVLSVLERKLQPGVFQMDGIFVDTAARGRGVGTALFDAVCAEAEARGMREVQLDVIDTNPRARALYERVGFKVIGEEETGPLRPLFGFRKATRMSRPVSR
ncbi:GNAT family N-acetyltransferase [Ruegeria sp. HKCCD8929]|uniref:GNAT family N-acetyltransferase n=1 Tax=Ruegeria sp. HKCCD8929 TaxID=2683006 RepID=UPI001488B89A|nr:GNAT family N-acetyltransferase [Ruegeria sp. HKCCD8929]